MGSSQEIDVPLYAFESINDSIFANIPLAADTTTEVAFHFQNGAITETRTIEGKQRRRKTKTSTS
jgi:hypothetical protein